MWLLNCASRRLEYFIDDRQVVGKYAILSHTWGEDEVSFDSIHNSKVRKQHGYRKIDYACKQAALDELAYVWIDTCCIDKKSSAELSEAINSMYRWYRDACVCYVYLEDFKFDAADLHRISGHNTSTRKQLPTLTETSLVQISAKLSLCRWFKRGWTLQELIAPRKLVFFNSAWRFMAGKDQMLDLLSQITKITRAVLVDAERLRTTSFADIMSWAASRKTTREEDRAYSLLGLLDVNMPLLYGEGPRAFTRLQEEVLRTWSRADHSILAHSEANLFATTLDSFHSQRSIIRKGWTQSRQDKFELSNHELRFLCRTRVFNSATVWRFSESDRRIVIALDCALASDIESTVGLVLAQRPHIDDLEDAQIGSNPIYEATSSIIIFHASELKDFVKEEITIARHPMLWPILACKVHISSNSCPIRGSSQTAHWDEYRRILSLSPEGSNVVDQQWKHAVGSIELQSSGLQPHVVHLDLRRNPRTSYDNPLVLDIWPQEGSILNERGMTGTVDYHPSISGGAGGLRNRSTIVFAKDDRPVLRVFSKMITIGNELLWSLEIREILELHADSMPIELGLTELTLLDQGNGAHSKRSLDGSD